METESIPGLEEKASLTRSKLKKNLRNFEPKGVPESVECTGLALRFYATMHSKIIYPENISKPTYTASEKLRKSYNFAQRPPNFAKLFFGKVDTYGHFFHYNRYDCKT